MSRIANPRATIPDGTPAEPRRPIPVPPKSDAEKSEAVDPIDPLAPGGSLFDEDDDAVEPNEPA
jgi:hypothetical protein